MNGRRDGAGRELDGLAEMVRGMLRCDAVVVALWGDGHGVGADGIAPALARQLALSYGPDAPPTDAGPLAHELLGYVDAARSSLSREGRVVGLVFALSHGERPDVALLDALARTCEFALEYGSAHTTTPQELEALEVHADSFASLLPALTRMIERAVGPVTVGVSVLDEATGTLSTADGSFGLPTALTRRYAVDPNDLHSNAARVFELQRPFVSNHVIGDPAILQDYPRAFGITSMIALPLVVGGRSIGVLMIANLPAGFRAEDLERATALAPRISVAVELARTGEARRRSRSQEAELLQHRERQRIADDLHDHVSQLLFAAQLALDRARGEGAADDDVRSASELVRRAETALRDAIFVLESPTGPLSAELASVARAARDQWGVDVVDEVDPALDARVPPEITAELVRAARECLTNAAKHAGPCVVHLAVTPVGRDAVRLTVTDDGTGARSGTSTGHGLASLRRRAADLGGELTLRSGPGGTGVALLLPLPG